MQIKFNEKNHTYAIDGEFASLSVTELLRKHGLAPDYSKVDAKVSEERRKNGKAIHKDLESVCNSNRYVPKTKEGTLFKAWANENLSGAVAEQMLAIKHGDIIIAGCADIMAIGNNGDRIIADHKNMAQLHKESVAWQVSLYDYMARQIGNEPINGKILKWEGATKFLCFQYNNGEMKTVELEKVPDSEIEKLLWAELNGEVYKRPTLAVSSSLKEKVEQAELALIQAEQLVAQAKEKATAFRTELVNQMKMQGVKEFETDKIKITYIAPYEKTTVDSKLLQSFYPAIYLNCVKKSVVKESVRITLKGEENNG